MSGIIGKAGSKSGLINNGYHNPDKLVSGTASAANNDWTTVYDLNNLGAGIYIPIVSVGTDHNSWGSRGFVVISMAGNGKKYWFQGDSANTAVRVDGSNFQYKHTVGSTQPLTWVIKKVMSVTEEFTD
jgi:hypothetical protein